MNNLYGKKKFDFFHIITVAILGFWALILLYPFYNAALVSIVPQTVYLKAPFLVYPKELDFSSYKFVFGWKTIWSGALVTVIITVVGTAYNLILTIFTAYALTKRIPGRKFFNGLILFTMYFGGGLIPFYLLMVKQLQLKNSLWSMILPTGINIMYMLIMRSYFYTIPGELEESAKIDGASELTILFRIFLPLCLPMLATVGLYYAVDRWNEWWLGMLFIQNYNKMPMQLIVRNVIQSANIITNGLPQNVLDEIFPEGVRMACIIVTILPIVCVYPFLQKYFVKGLVLGGVKG